MNPPDVWTSMKDANPHPAADDLAPDAWSTAVLLAEIDTRRQQMNMDLETREKPVASTDPPRSGRRSLIAAAAFAVTVGVVGLVAWLSAPGPDDDGMVDATTTQAPSTSTEAPTTTTTDPPLPGDLQGLARDYEVAFNEGDTTRFRSLFSDDAVRTSSENPGLELDADGLVDEMESLRVQQSVIHIENCVAATQGMNCAVRYSGPVETALILTDWTFRYGFEVRAGEITEITARCGLSNCRPHSEHPMLEWVAVVHPEDAERMSDPYPALAGDDAALWHQYAIAWTDAGRPTAAVQSATDQYFAAWNSGDVSTFFARFAADHVECLNAEMGQAMCVTRDDDLYETGFAQQARFRIALGGSWERTGCVMDGNRAACTFWWTDPWIEPNYLRFQGQVQLEFDTDGLVSRRSVRIAGGSPEEAAELRRLADWWWATDPVTAEPAILRNGEPVFTTESAELWKEYLPRYFAERS